MKLSLIVLAEGPMQGKVLPILTPQFVIGRDPGCHLRPSSPMISKKHCALIVKEERLFIKDFGSTNGSFVNDSKVEGHCELKNGDKLKIGPLFFEVKLENKVGSSAKITPKPAVVNSAATPVGAKASSPAEVNGSSKTPTPKPSVPKKAEPGSDDDLAALLLSGSEETVSDVPAASGDQGSTVLEMPLPGGAGAQTGENKPAEAPKPPVANQTNSEKAAAILEMMRKRPRTSS